jgi:hypothetical protein
MTPELETLGLSARPVAGETHIFLDEHDLHGRMISMGDLMDAGHCVPGIRTWFTQKNMDWRQLMRGGYPADDLALLGDGLVLAALRTILKRG